MIEFDGKIFGAAEKQMWKKAKQIVTSIVVISLTILFPVIILMWKKLELEFAELIF